jgi:acetyl esterase/lipase
MAAAGVSVELHVHPGVPHGFEMMAPHAEVSQRAVADRRRVIQSL